MALGAKLTSLLEWTIKVAEPVNNNWENAELGNQLTDTKNSDSESQRNNEIPEDYEQNGHNRIVASRHRTSVTTYLTGVQNITLKMRRRQLKQ